MNLVCSSQMWSMRRDGEGPDGCTTWVAGMKGAEALVRALLAHGARYLFGIPGVHTLPLYDALADYPELRPIVTRHEAGAAIAADGYARVFGQPGVVSVVP